MTFPFHSKREEYNWVEQFKTGEIKANFSEEREKMPGIEYEKDDTLGIMKELVKELEGLATELWIRENPQTASIKPYPPTNEELINYLCGCMPGTPDQPEDIICGYHRALELIERKDNEVHQE